MSAADLLIKKRRQRKLSLGSRQSLTVLVLLLLGDDVKVKSSLGCQDAESAKLEILRGGSKLNSRIWIQDFRRADLKHCRDLLGSGH